MLTMRGEKLKQQFHISMILNTNISFKGPKDIENVFNVFLFLFCSPISLNCDSCTFHIFLKLSRQPNQNSFVVSLSIKQKNF